MSSESGSLRNKLIALQLFPLRVAEEAEVEVVSGEASLHKEKPKEEGDTPKVTGSIPTHENPYGRHERLREAAQLNDPLPSMRKPQGVKEVSWKFAKEMIVNQTKLPPAKLSPRQQREELAAALRMIHATTTPPAVGKKLSTAEENLFVGEYLKAMMTLQKYQWAGLIDWRKRQPLLQRIAPTRLDKILGRPVNATPIPRWVKAEDPKGLAKALDTLFLDEEAPRKEIMKALEAPTKSEAPWPPPPRSSSNPSLKKSVGSGGTENTGASVDGRMEELIQEMNPEDETGKKNLPDSERMLITIPKMPRVNHGVLWGGVGLRPKTTGPRIAGKNLYQAMTTPGARVFRKMQPWRGGTVVVDCSGSMCLTGGDVDKILDAIPGCTIVGYNGMSGYGELLFLADRGRKIEFKEGGSMSDLPWVGHPKWPSQYEGTKWVGGNAIDDCVMRWLLRRAGNRMIVTDGGFCDYQGVRETLNLLNACVSEGIVTWATNITAAVKLVEDKKWPGKLS